MVEARYTGDACRRIFFEDPESIVYMQCLNFSDLFHPSRLTFDLKIVPVTTGSP
jgi:hypothetical protein